jgi:scyllo-inositol 2-dehydrogenase (NADP+)
MARDLRVGIVGYGLAGAVFHAPLVAATPGLEVAAIVTRNPERRERAERDHRGARVVAEVSEMLGEVDVAVVATPNREHVPVARAALEAGVDVVVDKPLAVTASEGRELVEEARRAGGLLTVFHNRRWDGDFLTVRRLLQRAALGRVVRFESHFERWRPQVAPGAWRERGDPSEGGGLLLDLGTHLVDQALVLFGRPRSVYAEVERRRQGATVDDDVFVALEHDGGVRSHLWTSMVAGAPASRFRVLGLEAAYVKDGLDPQEEALRAGARPGDAEWGREPEQRWGRLVAGDSEQPIETERGAYEAFYARLVSALREESPPPVDPMDAVAALEVLEAAARSAATRETVTS